MRPFSCWRSGRRSKQSLCHVSHPPSLCRRPTTTSSITSWAYRPFSSPRGPALQITQRRTYFKVPYLSSFLPSGPSNGNDNNHNNNKPGRVLSATRTLQYTPTVLFKVISSVESYSQFLPFLTASTVTARDQETGYPTQAFLTVGYGPVRETFTSRVDCDHKTWVVEARSGARFGAEKSQTSQGDKAGLSGFYPGASEGVFEYLSTRWKLVPLDSNAGDSMTKVHLEVRFEFRNQLHAALMGAVEGQMANIMIEAFEKRMKEVAGSNASA